MNETSDKFGPVESIGSLWYKEQFGILLDIIHAFWDVDAYWPIESFWKTPSIYL